ncbi:MAG TPA: dihydrodipicolinate reductase C-terminal domain-containing protein [Pyrinomonadaceae bacterium]
MKIALIGHGAMGQLVGARAREEGHEVVLALTSRDAAQSNEELQQQLQVVDVAVDFSVAGAVPNNVRLCARAGVPLVEGTTGWLNELEEARRVVAEHDGALLYGANFSVGVNVFYRIIIQAAELFKGLDYAPFIEEAHHSRKRDAPSGTALKLREMLAPLSENVSVASTRAGHIPGTHRVGFDSAADQITLTHTARSREGFAAGALLAAHWIRGRKGVYEFTQVFDEIIQERMKSL